mgnify:CR=1 FL=1
MLNLHAVANIDFHGYIIPVPTVFMKWAKWAALNHEGFVHIYDRKPELVDGVWKLVNVPEDTKPEIATIAIMNIKEDKVKEWYKDSLVEIVFPTLVNRLPERITLDQITDEIKTMKPSVFSCFVAATATEILEYEDFTIEKVVNYVNETYYTFGNIGKTQFEICFFNEINRMIYKLGFYTLLVDTDRGIVTEQIPVTFNDGGVDVEYLQSAHNSFDDIIKFSKLLGKFMLSQYENAAA